MRIRSVVLAVAAIGLGASPSVAACDGPAPTFDERIADATTIVIGEVVAIAPGDVSNEGAHFRLRVRHIVKGAAPSEMEISDLMLQPCAGPLYVNEADVIAIAFGAREFDVEVNPVAYIAGAPSRPDIRRVTVEEVFALAGVPLPVQAPEDNGPRLGPIAVTAAVAALILGASLFAFSRWRAITKR